MNKNSNGKKKKKIDENDQVEQLLQAAQDEMMLKFFVDSHISHISSNYLDDDLDRRFQSLKSRPSIPPPSTSSQSQRQPQPQSQSQSQSRVDVDDELKSVLGDDLSARFAALKASSTTTSNNNNNNNNISVDDDNEEDEVEKLIRWAKDAARLDPSPPSDGDDDSKSSDNNTDSDDDDQPHQSK